MSAYFEERNRNVVPRWRDVRTSASYGELQSCENTVRQKPVEVLFESKFAAWRDSQGIEDAVELISSAVITRRWQEAAGAAHFVLSNASGNVPVLLRQAKAVLKRSGRLEDDSTPTALDRIRENSGRRIAAIRNSLRTYPHNSLAWTDVAREYASVGETDKSRRAVQTAIGIDPNRFVRRSAARLFLHMDDADYAYSIIRTAPGVRSDPWLMAAELAIARLTNRPPATMRGAREMVLDNGIARRHIAELASAIATFEVDSGDVRKARRYFRISLLDPTENAIAQYEWASRRIELLDDGTALQFKGQSHEASASELIRARHFLEALATCKSWLADEPFSARPAMLGSYIAGTALCEYEHAKAFARSGLLANKGNAMLRNNLAVALACQNRVADAARELSRSAFHGDRFGPIYHTATQGLIEYRRGDAADGRALYESAITQAQHARQPRLVALARIIHETHESTTARVGQVLCP